MPMGQTEDVMNQRLLLIEISLTGIHEKVAQKCQLKNKKSLLVACQGVGEYNLVLSLLIETFELPLIKLF